VTARYSILPAVAFIDPRLTPCEIRVLGVLGSFLNKENECFPSQARIAEVSRLSRQRVNKAIRQLVLYGYVTTRERFPDSAKSTLIYKVALDDPPSLPGEEMQPALFAEDELQARKSQKPSLSSKATSMSSETTKKGKIAANIDVAKSDNDSIDVAQLGDNHVAHAATQEVPQLTSPDSSVPNGTAQVVDFPSSKADDDEEVTEPPSQPTKAELLKRLIWATGLPMLTGQGMAEKQARSFLGGLIKQSNLQIVARAMQRAAEDPPIEAAAWLRAAVTADAKRAGLRTGPATEAQRAAEADEERARWVQRFEHLAKTGKWLTAWGMDPRIGLPGGVPPELYDQFQIPWPAHERRPAGASRPTSNPRG
jgi:hypothetical protein